MENEFRKMAEGWKKERLTAAEKARILEHVFAAPVPSPYMRYARVLTYVRRTPAALALILVLGLGTTVFAAERSVPGEKLYTIKTRVIEPLVSAVQVSDQAKLDWEAEKVERRLKEADALAKDNALDDQKAEDLGHAIEKSSAKFAEQADKVARQAATSTGEVEKKNEEIKNEFKDRIEKRIDEQARGDSPDGGRHDEENKIEGLKDRAVKALESRGDGKGNKEEDH